MSEDSEWIIKGRYESIVKEKPTDEDYVEWTKNFDSKNVLHLLCISFTFN